VRMIAYESLFLFKKYLNIIANSVISKNKFYFKKFCYNIIKKGNKVGYTFFFTIIFIEKCN